MKVECVLVNNDGAIFIDFVPVENGERYPRSYVSSGVKYKLKGAYHGVPVYAEIAEPHQSEDER